MLTFAMHAKAYRYEHKPGGLVRVCYFELCMCSAKSQDEALGLANRFARTVYPLSNGFTDHYAAVVADSMHLRAESEWKVQP